jgi:hypothetical protein
MDGASSGAGVDEDIEPAVHLLHSFLVAVVEEP